MTEAQMAAALKADEVVYPEHIDPIPGITVRARWGDQWHGVMVLDDRGTVGPECYAEAARGLRGWAERKGLTPFP